MAEPGTTHIQAAMPVGLGASASGPGACDAPHCQAVRRNPGPRGCVPRTLSGEIHALLGENGAGKSTLIKIITGVYQPDRGEIQLDGKPVAISSAAEAQRLGIAAIYQEPLLFPDLNVAENIFISHQDRGSIVGWRKMFRDAEAILAELGVAIDGRSAARGLTLAAQQSVEIARQSR